MPVPGGCSAHSPRAQGRSWWPRWAMVWFVSAGLWLQGSLRGAQCPPKARHGPGSHPSAMAGGPGTLTHLFYFAVLGWSRRGALGQLSPPTPSPLPPDQVGPQAAPPPAASTPGDGLSDAAVGIRGCCPPDPAQLPSTVSSGADAEPSLWGQTCPPGPGSTGIPISSQYQGLPLAQTPPPHCGFTAALVSVPPGFRVTQGFILVTRRGPSLRGRFLLPNKA